MLFPAYLSWHYSAALLALFNIWRNFVWFTYHFFSIGLLTRTLFSPWRRLGEDYKKGSLDVESWFETLVVNTLMRAVGVLVRLAVIIFGSLALVLITIAILPALVAWLFLPLAAGALLIGGVSTLL